MTTDPGYPAVHAMPGSEFRAAGGEPQDTGDALSSEQLRLLIADDSAAFREGMTAMFSAREDIELVGVAADGAEAVRQALELQPDVIVMDLHMPVSDGIEATRAIISASPHIAVLALTMHDDDDSVFAAMQAGARGYIVKGARHTELLRAIHAVSDGGAVFGPSIARRLIDFFATASTSPAAPFPDLTPREREILELIARGRSNVHIAEHFGLSTKTVRNHVSNIFTKLQVVDRAEAIVKAREAGIGGR